MELHNDGTYVEEQTDYVLMMKIDEQKCRAVIPCCCISTTGSIWTNFSAIRWRAAQCALPRRRAENVSKDVFHPVFDVDSQGRPVIRYIDQFVQPKDFEEGAWLSALSDALETSKDILSVPVPVGKFLLINNLFWLHGRDRFTAAPGPASRTDAPARLLSRTPLTTTRRINKGSQAKELSGCMIS